MDSLFEEVQKGLDKIQSGVEKLLDQDEPSGSQHQQAQTQASGQHRFGSFAPQSSGQVKWFVDGASYFWAVSEALEAAQETIYILDWWLSPELYLRRPPARNEQYRLDNMLKAAAERGVRINVIVYKEVPQALTLDSAYTKQALESLHPNIKVFRHPDHIPSGNDVAAEIESNFKNLSLRAFDLARVSHDALKTIYGTSDDMVLFWAHHEKLCLIDNKIAFMGGLDLCFGRWDTNSHPIADAHPNNLDAIIFPGQDYNNARIYDFQNVQKWENNKLDRTKSSRMGWSDISINLSGPIVNSLVIHFIDRWNYIYGQKYITNHDGKYQKIIQPGLTHQPPPRGLLDSTNVFGGLQQHFQRHLNQFLGQEDGSTDRSPQKATEGAHMQLCRSCCPWSSGHPTEHSIQNAYIAAITNAQHFVYIENQFFITSTGAEKQKPVSNLIGKAIVDRIKRAHESGEDFHIIVNIPAVPGFAGDLKADGALGTRAIMEYQYNSINRGGYSIIESLRKAGVQDTSRYINFYNLRNYDRINAAVEMRSVERAGGVSYEDARDDFDAGVGQSYDQGYQPGEEQLGDQYQRYQRAARRQGQTDKSWDTVSTCYTSSGPSLQEAPWTGSPNDEINAYVSEELYIHTKVLIADDRLVICGSANLNDRSQLGDHDSEIAVVIEDPTPVRSAMGGQPYTASAFAASLRRQLFRKHLGLLPDQPVDAANANWTPVWQHAANQYDWDSDTDQLVADPLDRRFRTLWTGTARKNTDVFGRAFHPVPSDRVRNWDDYKAYFEDYFVMPPAKEAKDAQEEREQQKERDEGYAQGKVDYGHVVRSEFPGGAPELKDWLAQVKGTLIEMPLHFLAEVEDLAKQGLSFNGLTDELYT